MTAWHRLAVFTFLVPVAMAATGCRIPIINIGPGSAPPGLLYTNTSEPNFIEKDDMREIPYDPSLIEMTGWYETKRFSTAFTGRLPIGGSRDLVAIKESDYASTFHEIIVENELDGMVNKTVDTRRWVLNLIIIRFSSWHTLVGGTGYRFTEEGRETLRLDADAGGDESPVDTIPAFD